MIHFELTTAGLAALTTDQGTAAVQIRRIQLGSGGRDDLSAANRAALETPRDSAPVAGSAGSIDSGVLLSAEVAATAGYQVTEIGIWARIGDAGVEFLLAYWASSTPAAAAVTGVTLLVPAALQIVDAAADVTVTVSPSLTLAGVGTYLGLPDTPNALVAGAYQRVTSPNPVALESVSRAQVLDDLLGQLNGEGNTKVLRGGRSWYELLTAGGRVRPDRLGSNPDSTKILHGDGSWRSAPPFLIHVGGSGAVSADLIAGDRVRAVFAGIPVRDRSRAVCRLVGTNPLIQAFGRWVDPDVDHSNVLSAVSVATLDATLSTPASGVSVHLEMEGVGVVLREIITGLAVIWRPA